MTRFNVRFRDGASAPGDAWLRDRIKWFDRFTAPSMAAQTSPPESWIVFCDSESPEWLLSRLETVATVWPVEGAFTPAVAVEAVDAVGGMGSRVITTRLDNDDAIASDFLATVQREARGEGFLNLVHGLQLAGDKLYRRSDPSNAFISRVEVGTVETVFAAEHRLIAQRYPTRQLRTAPMWLQVVHGGNVANAAHGIRTSSEHLRRFAVEARVTNQRMAIDRALSAARLGTRVVRRPHRIAWAWRVARSK